MKSPNDLPKHQTQTLEETRRRLFGKLLLHFQFMFMWCFSVNSGRSDCSDIHLFKFSWIEHKIEKYEWCPSKNFSVKLHFFFACH